MALNFRNLESRNIERQGIYDEEIAENNLQLSMDSFTRWQRDFRSDLSSSLDVRSMIPSRDFNTQPVVNVVDSQPGNGSQMGLDDADFYQLLSCPANFRPPALQQPAATPTNFVEPANLRPPALQQPAATPTNFVEPAELDCNVAYSQPAKRKTVAKVAKPRKSRKVSQHPDQSDEEGEDGIRDRWTDEQVHTLIALRGEMDSEFEAQAGKQGVNVWLHLQKRMVVMCRGFTKSAGACKKKWMAEYNKYKLDKRHNTISGNDRKVTCRFYDRIDESFYNRANVSKQIHSDGRDSDLPCADNVEAKRSPVPEEPGHEEEPSSSIADRLSAPSKGHRTPESKQNNGDRLLNLLNAMVESTMEITSEIKASRQASKVFFKSFDVHMGNLINKL